MDGITTAERLAQLEKEAEIRKTNLYDEVTRRTYENRRELGDLLSSNPDGWMK